MEFTEISGVFLSGPYRKGGPGLRSGNVYVAGFTTGGLDGNTSAETFKECGERFGIEENFPGDKSNDVPGSTAPSLANLEQLAWFH